MAKAIEALAPAPNSDLLDNHAVYPTASGCRACRDKAGFTGYIYKRSKNNNIHKA